ncbi:radical SAM protein [bacterium]|nr:radical SAM protein [bacterium]MCB9475930.1 radical SAM protein [Deltaproteobacteria bacterium]
MWSRDITLLCPTCQVEVEGHIVERDGDLFTRGECAEHGPFEKFFWRDADLYRESLPPADQPVLPKGPLDVFDDRVAGYLTTFAIDITNRCNLTCPTCVSQAVLTSEVEASDEDESLDDLLKLIPDYRGKDVKRLPNISLVGGESSLRPDLPEFIERIIREKGITPRLNSNGLLLMDEKRLDRLYAAGLRWVILQFDGFTPEPSIEFRGHDFSKRKLEIIAKLAKKGFFVHLACMVQKGVNDAEVGEILRFAAKEPNIRRVSFYPRSDIGRFDEPDRPVTHVIDVMHAIENGTDGQVSADDVRATKRLGDKLYRLTGNPMFRPRPCIFPFVLMRDGERLVSCHKFFSPGSALRNLKAAVKFARHAPKMLKPDEGRFPSDFLFVNIEKFYDGEAFDVHGAHNCHHVYLTPEGALPFCVYNTTIRGKSALQKGGGCGVMPTVPAEKRRVPVEFKSSSSA